MCFHQEQISNTVTVLQYSFNSGMVVLKTKWHAWYTGNGVTRSNTTSYRAGKLKTLTINYTTEEIMDKFTDSDSSSNDSSDSSTPPSPVRIKNTKTWNRYKNILSNEDEDKDGEVAADNNSGSDSDSDKGEDEDEDEDADEYEDEDNDEDEDDDSNGDEIAPDKNNNEEDPDPSGKAKDKGFWKKTTRCNEASTC